MKVLLSYTAIIFMAIALSGMVAHAVKKWAKGEIRGNLVDWYVVHPKASAMALLGCFGGVGSLLFSGVLTDYNDGAQFIAAFMSGWGCDSFNSQGPKR